MDLSAIFITAGSRPRAPAALADPGLIWRISAAQSCSGLAETAFAQRRSASGDDRAFVRMVYDVHGKFLWLPDPSKPMIALRLHLDSIPTG